jgi:hypothetical protein
MDNDFAESYLFGDEQDFDVIKDYSEAVDGEITAWNTLVAMADAGLIGNDAYQFIRGNNPDGTPNPGIGAMVDVVSLADYMVLISMEVTGLGSPQLGSHQKSCLSRQRIQVLQLGC